MASKSKKVSVQIDKLVADIEIPKNTPSQAFIPNNLGEAPYDTLLVLQDDFIQESAGGILIPDLSQEKPDTGIVISVGERYDGRPNTFAVGDRVLFGQEAGRPINIKGVEYLLLIHRNVLWNFKH